MARRRRERVLHYMGAGSHGRQYEAVCGRASDTNMLTPDVRYVECEHCKAWLRGCEEEEEGEA